MTLWSVLKAILAFYSYNFMAVVLTTIFLHRAMTHSSVTFDPRLSKTFKFLIWVLTGIVIREWVGIHRWHHAESDGPHDPHSPWIYGFWTVQFWNVALYGEAVKDAERIEKHTRSMPYTRMDRLFFNRGWLGLGIGLTSFYLIFGLPGIIGFVLGSLTYLYQSSTVNAMGHFPNRIGYQNYTGEHAEKTWNLRLPWYVKILIPWRIGGEEFHNNHHEDPKSAIFGHEIGEFDIGAVVIRFLVRIGFASDVHTPKAWKRAA